MDNYNNINYQSTESFSSSPIENNTENNIFIINWIFQILLWIDLLLIIIINIDVPIIIFIFLYLIYLIIEFNSPLKGQLYSLYEKSFYEELKKIISSSLNIKFNIETFHFKNRIHPTIKLSKNTISPTIITRVISYKNSIDFPYYSFKDVSGVLYLEDEINKSNEYSFIKLKIKQEINFADEISYNDYITFRNNLILKNKNIDSFVNIKEIREILNCENEIFCKIGNVDTWTIGYKWFIFFVLIGIGELYNLYFNSFYFEKTYTIRKLISTRYNLIEGEFIDKYYNLLPCINLGFEKMEFKNEESGFCFKNFEPIKPNNNELSQLSIYSNEIPNYQIFPSNKVIVDIPKFQKQKYFNIVISSNEIIYPPFLNKQYNQ